MHAEDRFERVLEHLYRAALADGGWESAATMINDVFGTTGHGLTYADAGPAGVRRKHLTRFFLGTRRRRDKEQLYFRDYYPRDEAVPRLHGLREGELVYLADIYTDREKRTSAAYNEFHCATRSENGLLMGLGGRDGQGIVISFGNSRRPGGWGHDQIEAIKRLGPHVRQFARIRRTLADAEALGASLAELLENRRTGIIHLDCRGRIVKANDRARDILLKRDGLGDRGGVLAAGNREENARLLRLLARALPPFGARGAGGSMKITRRKSPGPVVLEVHPVRKPGTDYSARRVAVLVLIVDPAARPPVDRDLVAKVLGLTPMQSKVAVTLAAGQTVAGTANALGCAESTVRTHLKRVYQTLGIRRRTELVQRILPLESLRQR